MKILITLFLSLAVLVARPVVVLDAGHGGHDVGGGKPWRVYEKNLALDTAKRFS